MSPKRLGKLIFLAFFLGAVFLGGFYYGKSSVEPQIIFGVSAPELGKPEGVDFSLFWSAWGTLQGNYIDRDKLDYKKMLYGAISGMVKSLGDPYTVFLPPEDTKIFKEDISGEFQGVGMEIGIRGGVLTVISPLEGTPAFRAGLLAGDKIIKVNGTSTADMTIDQAVKLIRGPKGTEVTLTVLREGWKEPKDITIIRDKINIPSLKLEIKENNIAYIKIYHFSERARIDFAREAVKILNSGADKIIVDLRNNPGGFLEIAQNLAGWFLEPDDIVTIEDFGPGKDKKEYRANGNGKFLSYNTVVLINKGSASASEIFAGALRDNRGARLIGERSFGKGSVQELKELREGSLKITIARWLTPKGDLIEGKGLEPDIRVEMTQEDIENNRDPQLDKAIEILNNI